MLMLAISGCGSDTGSRQNRKLAIKTSGLIPPGLTIGALQLTLNFPTGVYAQTVTDLQSPTYGEPLPSVVTLVGGDPAKEVVSVKYLPATNTTPGQLKFIAANVDGFAPGEYIVVDLDIIQGFTPVAADFSIVDFVVSDINSYSTYQVTDPVLTVQIY
jgi:hypothetical protein